MRSSPLRANVSVERFVRLGFRLSIASLILLAPAGAFAQLPIPTLGDTDAPNVRIATDDTLLDEINGFIEAHALRRRSRETAMAEIETMARDRLITAPDGTPTGDPESIELAIERERELLAETTQLAAEAKVSASIPVVVPKGAIALEDLIAQALAARRLEDEVASSNAIAKRLNALVQGEPPSPPPDASFDQILDAQAAAIRFAEAGLATARAYDRTARHRLASRRVQLWRSKVSVGAGELESAKQALARSEVARKSGEQAITKERKTLRESSVQVKTRGLAPDEAEALRRAARALRRERVELLVRQEERLAVDVILSRARFLATTALSSGQLIALPEEMMARVAARIAKIEQDRSSNEAAMAALTEHLREAPAASNLAKTLRAQQEVQKSEVALLLEMRQALRVVETIDQIAHAQQVATESQRSVTLGLSLSLIVLIGVLLLLRFGMQLIRASFSRGTFDKLFEGTKFPSSRAEAALVLIWPMVVLLSGAALLVWPIWRLDLTLIEALATLGRPLFYVESTGVSVLSFVELIGSVWASLVVSRFMRAFLQTRVYETFALDIGMSNAVNTFVHYGIMGAGVLIGLRFVGVGASSFALLAGVLGIGIGFGLRNITENFISGLIILAERPVKLGDFIDIGGELQGQVHRIRARSTTVITRDNISVIIPNSELVGGRVTNWSHEDAKIRFAVPVGVAYGSDTDMVRRQLLDAAGRHGQVMKKPAPEVQFRAFGSSSLDFVLLVWIDDQQHRFRIASDLHFAIDKAFRKVGIEIAFPQMDLHLRSISEGLRSLVGPTPTPDADATPTELPVPGERKSDRKA